jgi:hypothetical protein
MKIEGGYVAGASIFVALKGVNCIRKTIVDCFRRLKGDPRKMSSVPMVES